MKEIDEFVVYSADEKYLIDYLQHHVKLRDWKRVAQAATDLVEFKAKQEIIRDITYQKQPHVPHTPSMNV